MSGSETKVVTVMYVLSLFSDAFMINLALVLGFTAYITLYPFQWLEDLLEVCPCISVQIYAKLDGLFRLSLNGIRTGNIGLLYIMLNFLTAAYVELKWDQEVSECLTKPFCTIPGELMGRTYSYL